MTVLTLPTSPGYKTGAPRLLSFGVDQKSAMGGATQRILRLGSRFAIDVEYAPMSYSDAQTFIAFMVQSEANPIALTFPQRGLNIGSPGSPVVNGSGQTGSSLVLRNCAGGYGFQVGQFFDFITAGRRSLHMITAATNANGGGVATLAIAPMLRTSPNDNDTVEVASPYIEGFLPLGAARWSIEMLTRVGVKLTIEEDR